MNSKFAILLLTAALYTGVQTSVWAAIDPEPAQSLYEEAVDYFRLGSLPEASIQLRNVLQQEPEHLPARVLLGRILTQQDRPHAAIKEFEKALSIGGDENLILVPLARAYLKIARPDYVITAFNPSGHEPAVDGMLMQLQGEAYLALGRRKEALDLYLSAASLLPLDPMPLLGQVKIRLLERNFKKASLILDEAITVAPESFDVWVQKAIMHRDMRQFADAEAAFERALKIKPASVRALTARAAMKLDVGQIEAAKQDLEAAFAFNRDSLETVYLRTLIMFLEGQDEEARALLAEAANSINTIKEDFRKHLPNTQLMLGVVAYFNRNYEEAIAHLKSFLADIPLHPGALRYLASAYLGNGEHAKVVRLLNPKTVPMVDSDPMLMSLLAESHRNLGQLNLAEKYYEAAFRRAPGLAGIGVRLAMSQLEAGNAEEAINNLKQLAERFPGLIDARIQLARAYTKAGQLDMALESGKALLADFPERADIQLLVSGVYLEKNDLVAAQLHAERALSINRDALKPRLNLARLARLKGNAAEAEVQYRAALEKFPNSSVVQLELANLLVGTADETEAIELINATLATDADNFRAHQLRLDMLLRAESDIDEIRNSVAELLNQFDANPQANLAAGRAMRAINDQEQARLYFRRGVDAADFDVEILLALANQQFAISDARGALWSLTKANQSNPNHPGVLVLLSAVKLTLGDLQGAGQAIADLEARHGATPEGLTVKGDWLMAQSNYDAAIAAYAGAYEKVPNRKTVRTLFRALTAAEQPAKAIALMEGWLKHHVDDLGSRHMLAQVQMQNKQWDDVRKSYEFMQSQGAEDIVLLNNLASAYQHLGDARALPTAKLAYEKAPEEPSVMDTYGWILTQHGQTDEGLAILREAFARASTSPEIRYHIGVALSELGREAEASEELEAALGVETNFPQRSDAEVLLNNLRTQP